MKNIVVIMVALFFSCEAEPVKEKEGQVEIIGTWKLEKMVNSWSMEEVPLSEIGYEEFYEFRTDNSVRKYRSTGEEAIGVYTEKKLSDGIYYEIAYENPDNDLKESCGENEFLKIEENLLKGGSLPCDGPGLFYEKIENVAD